MITLANLEAHDLAAVEIACTGKLTTNPLFLGPLLDAVIAEGNRRQEGKPNPVQFELPDLDYKSALVTAAQLTVFQAGSAQDGRDAADHFFRAVFNEMLERADRPRKLDS